MVLLLVDEVKMVLLLEDEVVKTKSRTLMGSVGPSTATASTTSPNSNDHTLFTALITNLLVPP